VRGPAYPWRLAVISGFGGREKYCQNGGMAVAHHYGAPSREGRPPGVRGRHCGPREDAVLVVRRVETDELLRARRRVDR